jgi:hypothetical protein
MASRAFHTLRAAGLVLWLLHVFAGALFGLFVLYPLLAVGFSSGSAAGPAAAHVLWSVLAGLIEARPVLPHLAAVASVLGTLAGLGTGWCHHLLSSQAEREHKLERDVLKATRALVALGDTWRMVFYPVQRWPPTPQSSGADPEPVPLCAIAALYDSGGGLLVLGADDAGAVTGVEATYARLGGREGLRRYLLRLISKNLPLTRRDYVDLWFVRAGERDLCLVFLCKGHTAGPAASGCRHVWPVHLYETGDLLAPLDLLLRPLHTN